MRLNIQLFIFFVLIILSSCGDDKKDEPNNPVEPVTRTWINIERENPFRETPLMAPYERSFGRKMWTTRVVEDSGLKGKGGDYYYWEQHKAEAGTMEELLALCDVPEDKLYAMSTRNLALTCFMHPYNGVYDMYNVLYESVFTMTLANCYQELMQRLTGATELLNLYCELDYPKSKPVNTTAGLSYEDYNKNTFENILHLNGLTLFLMTAVDFNALNKEQLSVLSSEIFKKIDNIATADEGVYDYLQTKEFMIIIQCVFHISWELLSHIIMTNSSMTKKQHSYIITQAFRDFLVLLENNHLLLKMFLAQH